MTFFLAAVLAGARMVEEIESPAQPVNQSVTGLPTRYLMPLWLALPVAAPAGLKVAVADEESKILLLRCTNRNYQIFVERVEKTVVNPDFSIISTRYDDDKDYFRKMNLVLTISRGKTGFAVIQKVP